MFRLRSSSYIHHCRRHLQGIPWRWSRSDQKYREAVGFVNHAGDLELAPLLPSCSSLRLEQHHVVAFAPEAKALNPWCDPLSPSL